MQTAETSKLQFYILQCNLTIKDLIIKNSQLFINSRQRYTVIKGIYIPQYIDVRSIYVYQVFIVKENCENFWFTLAFMQLQQRR